MAFLDEDLDAPEVAVAAERPGREDRARRGRRQFLLRRLIGVGLGFAILLLFVLGVKGCLNARQERGIENYTRDLSAIATSSAKVGQKFFSGTLNAPGGLSDIEFRNEILGLRGESQSLLDRIENLDAPADLKGAQAAMTQALTLRRDALGKIADNVTAALGDTQTSEAFAQIQQGMGALFSSDVLYAQVVVPSVARVLDEQGISSSLPAGNFMPRTGAERYLTQARIAEELNSVTGGAVAPGLHGLGLIGVSIDGVVLDPDTTTTIPASAREVEVMVQNQGEAEENDVVVSISFNGRDGQSTIASIPPGKTLTRNVRLTALPQTGANTTLEVVVESVPGEQVSDNNQATYTVVLG